MSVTGDIFLGSSSISGRDRSFRATDPSRGEPIEPGFAFASEADVARACALAAEAFARYSETSLEERAGFLEAVAQAILDLGEDLVERAVAESGLPRARIEGERGRTVGQLRHFAAVVRQGEWLDLRVDPALPDRKPLPRPDLRLRQVALGPVAVFGASNFPLAFSVGGGDTASALAAGCPVVVKGHPAHPGTGELVGRAIRSAVGRCGLPDGTFSVLLGDNTAGAALVRDPHIKAVGFTGSRSGGLALARYAADRPEPIPVYAEMSSVNPVYLLPGALKARADKLGRDFVGSLTLGSGQFCTNPGLVFGIAGDDFDSFLASAGEALKGHEPAPMLTRGIYEAYQKGVAALLDSPGVTCLARGRDSDEPTRGASALFAVDAADFAADERLGDEVFGSSSLAVRFRDIDEMIAVSEKLEGQLTATLHVEPSDYADARRLVPVLERKAGRILCNGWPTGVEVSSAMVHGGPFPATSDSRTTSVGALAIRRFLRPVCYQDLPADLLPDALKPGAVDQLPHLLDGKRALAKA